MPFCIAIKAEIVAATCPLQKGKCYWQHRRTHVCTYTEQEMDSREFALHVGMSNYPTTDQVGRYLVRLRDELKKPLLPSAEPVSNGK